MLAVQDQQINCFMPDNPEKSVTGPENTSYLPDFCDGEIFFAPVTRAGTDRHCLCVGELRWWPYLRTHRADLGGYAVGRINHGGLIVLVASRQSPWRPRPYYGHCHRRDTRDDFSREFFEFVFR